MSTYCGVLLAAGRGLRFRAAGDAHADKLLQPLPGGQPDERVAERAARRLAAAGLHRVVAVLRERDGMLAARLAGAGAQVVACADADRGMGHSLAAGVAAAPDASGWLIALADMPYVQVRTLRAVASRLAAGGPRCIVAPVWQGRRGHPVAFGRHWRDDLLALQGDAGARDILARAGADLCLLAVDDPGVLRDVDAPADLLPR